MELKNGTKRARGGRRPGAGRKTEDFRKQLDACLNDGEVLQTINNMARGINGMWSEKVRLSAALWLLEMKNGKARQSLEHSGADGGPLTIQVINYAQ